MLDSEYINELVKKSAEFGGGKIHIIVNNAGFTWDGVMPFRYGLSNSKPDCCLGNTQDDGQAMGHHSRLTQYRTFQASEGCSAIFQGQRWRT